MKYITGDEFQTIFVFIETRMYNAFTTENHGFPTACQAVAKLEVWAKGEKTSWQRAYWPL